MVIYAGILLWVVGRLKQKRFDVWDALWWGLVAYFLLVSAGAEAYYRFRVPLMPILSVYAGAGLTQAGNFLPGKGFRRSK